MERGAQSVDFVRKAALVAALVAGLVVLHRFAAPPDSGFDPRGLLALGFVVLAAYAIGELAELIRLPHITGYLLAGLALGPSVAHELSAVLPWALPPPFDNGILNEAVIGQLTVLDTLALPLICLAAGGELDLATIRKGLRPLLTILGSQAVLLFLGFIAFTWVISGPIQAFALPALTGLPSMGVLAIGGVLGSLALATSAAATIAVILGSGSKGPMSNTVLSVVVLKDVAVVLLFAVFSAAAANALGVSTGGGGLLTSLRHIGLSIVLGAAIGGLIHLYLRYVKAEQLLFLVGLIYTSTWVTGLLHGEVALVFLTAGFVVGNFWTSGDALIEDVERLSMPVFVVFFTLAGARLHLDVIVELAGFATALVLLRGAGIWAGWRIGATAGGAEPTTRKYGWLGMLSQAGLSISLASQLPRLLPGEVGEGLFSLVLAGVAVHEVVGPALLQVGLERAGETSGAREAAAEASPSPGAETAQSEASAADPADPWSPPTSSSSPEVVAVVEALQGELVAIVAEWSAGPPARSRSQDEAWLTALRREFLRAHRRAGAILREGGAEQGERLREVFGELSGAWKEQALRRAARPTAGLWPTVDLVRALDRAVDAVASESSATVVAPVEPETLIPRPEPIWRSVPRWWLRTRHRFRPVNRVVALGELCRYHLGGVAVGHLEGLPALGVRAQLDLAARVASTFGTIARGFQALAAAEPDGSEELLWALRTEVDEEFQLAHDSVSDIEKDAAGRAAAVIGRSLRALKSEVGLSGTLDLPYWTRRAGRVFEQRNTGLAAMTSGLQNASKTLSARYAALALDIEVASLSVAVADAVERHGASLERLVEDLGARQLRRAEEAVRTALEGFEKELAAPTIGEACAAALRARAEPASRVLAEARRLLLRLREQLEGEGSVGPLRDELLAAGSALTDWYTVPARRISAGEWSLTAAVPTAELPLRELVLAFVETTITADLHASVQATSHRISGPLEAIEELERVLGFNLDLATAELEVFREPPLPADAVQVASDMLVGAVGRSHHRLERAIEELCSDGEPGAAVREDIGRIVLRELRRLREMVSVGEISELRRLLLREAAVGRALARGAGLLSGPLPEAVTRAVASVQGAVGADRIEALRVGLGLPSAPRPTDAAPAAAFAAPSPRVELPVVYRRLFSDQATGTGELLVGRESELSAARAMLTGQTEAVRAVAVVGPPGSGKGALAQAVWRGLDGPEPELVIFDAPTTAEDVTARLESIAGGRVHVDGLEWLFELAPGGAAPLQALVERIVDGPRGTDWILVAEASVWRSAAALSPLGEAMTEIVAVGPLGLHALEEAMLARHAMSAYELEFEAPDPLLARLHLGLRGAREASARQRRAWFEALHEASGGVMIDALRMWMASVDEVDEKGAKVRMGRVPDSPVAALATLGDDELLCARHALRQGWISPEVHSKAFQTSRATSRALLAGMEARGLLVGRAGVHKITGHLRAPLFRLLCERGWAP